MRSSSITATREFGIVCMSTVHPGPAPLEGAEPGRLGSAQRCRPTREALPRDERRLPDRFDRMTDDLDAGGLEDGIHRLIRKPAGEQVHATVAGRPRELDHDVGGRTL